MTSNQDVYSQKSSFMHEIPFMHESLKFPDMKETSLTGIPDMDREGISESNQVPNCQAGERSLPSILTGKNLLSSARKVLEPNRIKINLSLSRKVFTPQPLRAVGVLFSPMVSGWAGRRWAGGGK